MAKIKPIILPPQPRKRKPVKPTNMYMWWPLNDSPHTIDVGGTGSQVYKQGFPFNIFTASSNWGALSAPNANNRHYDPRVGGYCYNNNVGLHLQSANNNEITFVNFGEELFTASVWVYLTALPPTTVSPIIHKSFSFPNNISIALQADQATSKWQFQYTTSGVLKTTTAAESFVINRWYHLVATYDGVARNLYVDGALSARDAEVANPDGNGEVWCIGNRSANDQVFPGFIWNVQFYTRALKGSEVKKLYLSPGDSFVPPDSPNGWFPFDPGPPVPPPPGGTPGIGGIVVGDNAIPVIPGNRVVGPRSGHIPIF